MEEIKGVLEDGAEATTSLCSSSSPGSEGSRASALVGENIFRELSTKSSIKLLHKFLFLNTNGSKALIFFRVDKRFAEPQLERYALPMQCISFDCEVFSASIYATTLAIAAAISISLIDFLSLDETLKDGTGATPALARLWLSLLLDLSTKAPVITKL